MKNVVFGALFLALIGTTLTFTSCEKSEDVLKYGDGKRNPHKRQEPFVEEICPQCEEKMGFPTLIVFDSANNLLFNSTGLDSLEFIQLKEALDVN